MKRTILNLADYGGAYSGGFITSLVALAPVIEGLGFRPLLAFSGAAEGRRWLRDIEKSGVEYRVLPPVTGPLSSVAALKDMFVRESVEIAHTHFTAYDMPAAIAAGVMGRRAPGILWHVHSAFPVGTGLARLTKDAIKMRIVGRRARSVAVSDALRDSFVRRGFPRERISVVHNGVDLARLRPAVPREQVREQLGIPLRSTALLVFGWDPVTKGIDVVLEASRMLRGWGRDVHWVIVGDHRVAELVEREACKGLIHVGPPREDVGSYYSACDGFVVASRWEGFAYALAEAVGVGLPAVATNIAGVQWAKDIPGVTMCDAGDAGALARAVAGREWPMARSSNGPGVLHIETAHSVHGWARTIGAVYQEMTMGRTVERRMREAGASKGDA